MICPICGALADDTNKFCPGCGALLAAADAGETDSIQPGSPLPEEEVPYVAGAPAAPAYTPPPVAGAPVTVEAPPAFNPASIPAPPPKPVRQPVYTQKQLMPFSTGQAVLFSFICAIPLVGLICEFIWAFSPKTNLNRRAFARAALIWTAVFLGIAILLAIVFLAFLALNPQFDLRLFLMNTFFA